MLIGKIIGKLTFLFWENDQINLDLVILKSSSHTLIFPKRSAGQRPGTIRISLSFEYLALF